MKDSPHAEGLRKAIGGRFPENVKDVAVFTNQTCDATQVRQVEDGVRPLVLLEASGGLELPVAAVLAAAALPVKVVNPRQVRHFACAAGKLAKTDALDAQLLAHFAAAVRPASLARANDPGPW
ncbi:MAG: hypothetical protein KatS3mg131_0274 [Candidatus Tectimicrobiota bacterium]|nr:MAG: hypothetical protein KatS3mg131_0274 [Candidatus Tectomicrobia bacterium]